MQVAQQPGQQQVNGVHNERLREGAGEERRGALEDRVKGARGETVEWQSESHRSVEANNIGEAAVNSREDIVLHRYVQCDR